MNKMTSECFRLGIPDYVTIETEEGSAVVSTANREAGWKGTKVEFTEASGYEEVSITSVDAVKGVKVRWSYQWPDKVRFLGDAWERGYGDLEWRGMSGRRIMPWYFLAAVPGETMCFGVMVQPRAMCYWQADSEGVTLYLDVRCGGRGVLLEGRTLHAAKIVCEKYTENTVDEAVESQCGGYNFTYESARSFCIRMCPNPILPEFPVYGSNNWYYAYGKSSEEEILADTKELVKLTRGASNPPFMVIDDCWQEHHRLDEYNGGPWKKGNAKFPDMSGIAQKMKNMGVRTGIWVRFLLNEDEVIPDEWRLSHNQCLDPSHPDALRYITEDAERICKWGFQLIKHDFSTFDLFGKWGFEMNPLVTEDGWHFYDRHRTSAEIVKDFYEAIYNAAKPYNTLILGCNTIGHLGAGLMQLNRTGDDTSGLNWERTRCMGVNTLAFSLPRHGTFYHIDADCVGITGDIPWELNRQWADAVVKSGTPLFISAKPGVLNALEDEELHQIMLEASRQEQHRMPLDWEDTDCPRIWGEGHDVMTYQWYEKSGPKLGSKTEKYSASLPLA